MLPSQVPWAVLFRVVAVCGAVVPGPCTFDTHREFDCSLGELCPRNFACADDGFCKSADIACADGETRCAYPGVDRVAICVADEDLSSSKTHCGGCFQRCLGAGTCNDGVCEGAPADGRCLRSRGNFDCAGGAGCVDDGNGDDGVCRTGAVGDAGTLEACKSGDDCEDGLCSHGLCTLTCDFGCPAGTACDDTAVPGGLCIPVADDACG